MAGHAHYREAHPLVFVITHWINLICMIMLAFSGFYIHYPFFDGFMGVARGMHFVAMYVIVINLTFRIIAAFFVKTAVDLGSREVDTDIKNWLPQAKNKHQFFETIKYYLFLRKEGVISAKYGSLQKIAYLATIPLTFLQAYTGFAIYGPTADWGLFSGGTAPFTWSATGLPAGVRAVGWDGRTAEGWGALVDGAAGIVSLAGANIAGEGLLTTRWTAARKAVLRDSRVSPGGAIVEAVARAKVKPAVVVQASGVGFYGSRGDERLDEGSGAGRDFLARLAAEEWEPSTEPVEGMGVRRVVIRSGAVLDAREGALPRLVLPFRFFVGGRLGSGRQHSLGPAEGLHPG